MYKKLHQICNTLTGTHTYTLPLGRHAQTCLLAACLTCDFSVAPPQLAASLSLPLPSSVLDPWHTKQATSKQNKQQQEQQQEEEQEQCGT